MVFCCCVAAALVVYLGTNSSRSNDDSILNCTIDWLSDRGIEIDKARLESYLPETDLACTGVYDNDAACFGNEQPIESSSKHSSPPNQKEMIRDKEDVDC
mmetsp:Transcript_32908/g.48730  ORF Transcript_32908/g.48730 Transcript_32908/m.48730 type:complete len:100 (-) Transcript_32908:591-890(-)